MGCAKSYMAEGQKSRRNWHQMRNGQQEFFERISAEQALMYLNSA